MAALVNGVSALIVTIGGLYSQNSWRIPAGRPLFSELGPLAARFRPNTAAFQDVPPAVGPVKMGPVTPRTSTHAPPACPRATYLASTHGQTAIPYALDSQAILSCLVVAADRSPYPMHTTGTHPGSDLALTTLAVRIVLRSRARCWDGRRARSRGRRPNGRDRILRNPHSAGARREVLQLPLGQRQGAEGRPAARHGRADAGGRRIGRRSSCPTSRTKAC